MSSSCLLCVPFCPDSSLPVKDGKLVGIRLPPLQGLRHLRHSMSLRGDHW